MQGRPQEIQGFEPVVGKATAAVGVIQFWYTRCNTQIEEGTMPLPNTRRIDRGNGSSIIDYRIRGVTVESRIVDGATMGTEKGWRTVNPEQLRSYVISNNVVVQ
jgi:hypothetical protein